MNKGISDIIRLLPSLRLIAKEAGITLSSITYHYKTKENLYREVLNRVLSYMTQDIEERVEAIQDRKSLSSDEAEQMLCDLIRYFVDRMFGPNSSIFAKIIIQEHFSPTIFYSELYEQYFNTDDLMTFSYFSSTYGFFLPQLSIVRMIILIGGEEYLLVERPDCLK